MAQFVVPLQFPVVRCICVLDVGCQGNQNNNVQGASGTDHITTTNTVAAAHRNVQVTPKRIPFSNPDSPASSEGSS